MAGCLRAIRLPGRSSARPPPDTCLASVILSRQTSDMSHQLAFVGAVIALSPAAAQQQPAIVLPPPIPHVPPPVFSTAQGQAISRQTLIDYRPNSVRCGSEPVKARHVERSLAVVRYAPPLLAPVTLRFRVDSNGRPLGIVQDDQGNGSPVVNDDLLPSFTAWQFTAGKPLANCLATFYPVAEPVDQVSPDAARRFIALSRLRPEFRPQAIADRARPAGDCMRNWPQILTQVFPRFDAIPAEPASLSHTTVAFDIDEAGLPRNVTTLSTGGNAALDAASREAIGKWRYAEGPRTGCSYPLHRNQRTPLPAPEGPAAASLRDQAARCEGPVDWQAPFADGYPQPYRKRAIEGWAIIGFDVAPWGATGNVRVLAAEPTADFGQAAKRMIERGRKVATPIGATGCVQRVAFRLDDR